MPSSSHNQFLSSSNNDLTTNENINMAQAEEDTFKYEAYRSPNAPKPSTTQTLQQQQTVLQMRIEELQKQIQQQQGQDQEKQEVLNMPAAQEEEVDAVHEVEDVDNVKQDQ